MRFEVDRFTDALRRAGRESDAQRAVEDELARAVSDPGALVAALGEPTQPGIHALHHDAELTVLNVIWPPWMVLLPHEHRMWASIGIYTGREDNIVWRRSGARIVASDARALGERDVFGLPDDGIHSVTNPIPRATGAIHVYGGDFFTVPRSEWDPETLRERPFDLTAARRSFRDADERSRTSR